MDLRHYWHLLRKWLWLIILGTLLVGGSAFVVSRNMTPVYAASTTLLVTPGTTQALDSYSSLIASERMAQTYAQLLQSAPILEETYQRLASQSVDRLEAVHDGSVEDPEVNTPTFGSYGHISSVSAQPVRDTQLLMVTVTGTDPDLITVAANMLVEVFVEWQAEVQRARYAESKANLTTEMEQVQASIKQNEDRIRTLQAAGESADENELIRLQDQLVRYRNSYSALLSSYSNIGLAEANSGATVTVVSAAVRPTVPIQPQVARTTLLAATVGALLAAGVAFLIEYLDDTVKAPQDLQPIGLTVVAMVQRVNQHGRNNMPQLFAVSQSRSLVAEAYRTLRTNLQFSSLDTPLRSLVVTSAVATEGKTTTAANLAVVMAQAGKRVVLVDGDLRRPSAHRLFDLSNETGLTTALVEDLSALSGFLRETGIENLRVLTAGPVPPNPQELLGSQRMEDLLHKLEEEADIVVLDTPPTLVVADANVLSTRTDGALVVVNTGRTRRAAVQQAVDGLRQVGAHLLGGVLNMVDTRGGRSSYYYYSHYYADQEWKKSRRLSGISRWLPRLRRRPTGRD
jgi:capsular exopolysaccharide synthesis family protein